MPVRDLQPRERTYVKHLTLDDNMKFSRSRSHTSKYWISILTFFFVSGFWMHSEAFASEPPTVLVSIAPLHALVSAVMGQVGSPELLVKGTGSPHHYTLRPSESRLLHKANVIFWGGPDLESFLQKPLQGLPASVKVVELGKTARLRLYNVRRTALFEPHSHADHEHSHDHTPHTHDHADGHGHDHHHDHSNVDMHFWLDPKNAKLLIVSIVAQLSKIDPAHAAQYRENARQFNVKLDAMDRKIRTDMARVNKRSFIVFHDAYQYFERYYGLSAAAAISIHPEIPPSVERLKLIRDTVKKKNAACIFHEPQFKSQIVQSIATETGVKVGELDPLGQMSRVPGEGYIKLLEAMSHSFLECFEGSQ